MQIKIKDLKDYFEKMQVLFNRVPKERIVLGVLATLLAGFLLYESLIAMQVFRLKSVNFQFSSEKKLLEHYDQLIQNVDALIAEAEEKERKFTQLKEKFVGENELPNYFDNFRALAKADNLQVASLEFKPQEAILASGKNPLHGYQRLPFNVCLKGDYFDLMLFIHKLEQGSPIFDIAAITLRQEGSNASEAAVDIKANIYIMME